MSLSRGEPALNASSRPSADQAGWETGGSWGVSRRTCEPSAPMRKSASTPSRSETNAISPPGTSAGGGGATGRDDRSGPGVEVGVHPTARHAMDPATRADPTRR
jgi:hypothetical protein